MVQVPDIKDGDGSFDDRVAGSITSVLCFEQLLSKMKSKHAFENGLFKFSIIVFPAYW